MKRRALLAALGALGAGCAGGGDASTSGGGSDNSGGTPEPSTTPTSVPRRTDNGDDILQTEELASVLESDSDFVERVTYVAVVDGVLRVRYESAAGDASALGDTEFNERVYVGAAYANWESDHDGIPLRATVVDAFDDVRYCWRMRPAWGEQLRNDEVSIDELGRQLSDTVTTPTPGA